MLLVFSDSSGNMLRITILAIAVTAVLAGDSDRKKCMRLLHPGSMSCCKSELPKPLMEKDDMKECFSIPHHDCDHDICVGKKRGYVSDDGTIDMDKLENLVTEDFKSSPSLVEAIKENCIKGDVSKYGPPDACKLLKLKLCTHKAVIMDCKEWDDNGSCAGIKDLVMECAKMDE